MHSAKFSFDDTESPLGSPNALESSFWTFLDCRGTEGPGDRAMYLLQSQGSPCQLYNFWLSWAFCLESYSRKLVFIASRWMLWFHRLLRKMEKKRFTCLSSGQFVCPQQGQCGQPLVAAQPITTSTVRAPAAVPHLARLFSSSLVFQPLASLPSLSHVAWHCLTISHWNLAKDGKGERFIVLFVVGNSPIPCLL